MRALSAHESETLAHLRNLTSAEIGFFEITSTQLKKSIIDANRTIVAALGKSRFHDYQSQLRGVEARVAKDAAVFSTGIVYPTSVSLYRPQTKKGDPRFWIARIGDLLEPFGIGDVVALIVRSETLIILNVSRWNRDFDSELTDFFSVKRHILPEE